VIAPPKGEKRAEEKVTDKFGGNWSMLSDIVRATVVVPDLSDMPKTLEALRPELEKHGWSIAEVENKFADPTPAGYRDVALKLQSDDGHVSELQVNTAAMWHAKETAGHGMYEEYRSIKEKDPTERSDADNQRANDLEKQMSELYDEAWSRST